MELIQALESDFETVKFVVRTTVNEIYPKYYPKGAVEFFLSYHCDDNIKQAIEKKSVYLLKIEDIFVGTGSVDGNELTRVFVLPQYQNKGYGTMLINALENILFEKYSEITLSASLPAYDIYLKRGYIPFEYHKMKMDNGDFLCYYDMKK